uniref:Uncharacterized protein n=1 Tax=Panagrolaimus sp. PS1159 TaxID=55785 RepID=A0AC35FGD2_9BILA
MTPFYKLILSIIIISFCEGNLLERLPCGRLLIKDALENCGSVIHFPLCEEIASKCCGSFSQCPMFEVLKCCNNGT